MTTLLFFTFTTFCLAQNVNRDIILTEELVLNGQITFGSDVSKVQSVYGSPDYIETDYWEVKDIMIDQHYYGDSVLYFHEDEFQGFDINTANFIFKYNEKTFKAGDEIHVLEDIVPDSYSHRSSNSLYFYLGSIQNGQLMADDLAVYVLIDSNEKISRVSVSW